MANTTATIFVLLMVVMQLEASIPPSPDCRTGFGCFSTKAAEYNRKILMDFVGKNQAVMIMKGKSRGKGEQRVVNGVELRRVPSGPDPLHHNVGPPKKPRSSP